MIFSRYQYIYQMIWKFLQKQTERSAEHSSRQKKRQKYTPSLSIKKRKPILFDSFRNEKKTLTKTDSEIRRQFGESRWEKIFLLENQLTSLLNDVRTILQNFKGMMREISKWMGKTASEFNKNMEINVGMTIPKLNLQSKIEQIEKPLTERKITKHKTEKKIETSRLNKTMNHSTLGKETQNYQRSLFEEGKKSTKNKNEDSFLGMISTIQMMKKILRQT